MCDFTYKKFKTGKTNYSAREIRRVLSARIPITEAEFLRVLWIKGFISRIGFSVAVRIGEGAKILPLHLGVGLGGWESRSSSCEGKPNEIKDRLGSV